MGETKPDELICRYQKLESVLNSDSQFEFTATMSTCCPSPSLEGEEHGQDDGNQLTPPLPPDKNPEANPDPVLGSSAIQALDSSVLSLPVLDRRDQSQQRQFLSDDPPEIHGFPPQQLSAIPPSDIPFQTPTVDTHVSISDSNPNHPFAVSLLSPAANPQRRPVKRKKGKVNIKKQQAIEKKYLILLENLNPIPFAPSKNIDFSGHERLLKRLGLWDFVHVEFDKTIRSDLIAQLIANYDPKMRCAYVNDFRIMVNRTDLGRAFKLPVKKEKAANLTEGMVLDSDTFSDESLSFIEDLVLNYVLLHEDMWMMPGEIMNWIQTIKDGNPDKVDWAGLVWFMVEKELSQGEQLVDCYYGSHLQYLIKSQREQLMAEGELREEPKIETELDAETKDEEDDGGDAYPKASETEENVIQDKIVMEETNIKLTLGQDIVKNKEVDDEMVDIKETTEEASGQWLLSGQNDEGKHFMQRCNLDSICTLSNRQEWKEGLNEEKDAEEDEEADPEAEDGFNLSPNSDTLVGDRLTGNLLQGLENTFSSGEFIASRSGAPGLVVGSSSVIIGDKRHFKHDYDISHHSLNDGNKRLRSDGYLDNRSSDFGMCMDQAEQFLKSARMLHEEKERNCQHLRDNQQMLLSELQRHTDVINQLQNKSCEELQKRDLKIFRLERELHLMGNLLDGYRKALKETDKAFFEYRKRFELPEEPIYKDAGPGGVVMSVTEIERQRQKQDEEKRLNFLILEEKFKETEEVYTSKFEEYFNKVYSMDERLMGLEDRVKLLKESSGGQKASKTSDCENQ